MIAAYLASVLASSEGAIKLLLSLLIGYPLALFFRTKPIYSLPAQQKHLIFIVIGTAIGYYNFGLGVVHSWVNITIDYLVLALLGGTASSVTFLFLFNTTYLMLGYFFYQINTEFGISWTMPQCVMTLRLTAVAFDYFDGQKKKKQEDSGKIEDSALEKCPSYLEMLSHTFYFGGYMVGPQFSMKRFQEFVNGKYCHPETKGAPDSVLAAMKRLSGGVGYIALYHCIALCIPDELLYAPEFNDYSLLSRISLVLLWGKNALHKYVGVWLVQEGVLILMGMSYNGKDENGETRWDGCTNIKVIQLETGESFHDFIQSFNVNTNQWMFKYIFKRLRFLGSKVVSQLLTLFYLALWHGLQSGYYMCFFLELVCTNAESKIIASLKRCSEIGLIPDLSMLSPLGRLLRKLLLVYLWSYALVPFSLHDWDKWHPVVRSNLYLGHILPFLGLILGHVLLTVLPRKPVANGVHSKPETAKKEQ